MTDTLSAALVLAALSGMLGLVRLWQRRSTVHPEVSRKTIHVGMGLITLTFPWLFESSLSVLLLAAGAASALVAIRILPRLGGMGGILHGVERRSMGEIYFPFGVAILFYGSGGDPLLYWPPLLLLTFADSIAALAGMTFGSRHYTTDDGVKTVEGSVAFFATAFVATLGSLAFWSGLDWTTILLVSALFGLIGVLLEAIAWRGLDNLFIPVVGFLFLDAFLLLEPLSLGWRLALLGALLLFTFYWKRRTTLNDSALLGAALFGYLVLATGGWMWALPALLLFLFYPHLVPYQPEARSNTQPAIGVLAVAAPGLFWLMLFRVLEDPLTLYPYAFTFAAHLGIIWVARWIEGEAKASTRRLAVHAVLSTLLIVIVPFSVGLKGSLGMLLYFLAALAGVAIACRLSASHFTREHRAGEPLPGCWLFRGSLVFALSLILQTSIVLWRSWPLAWIT